MSRQAQQTTVSSLPETPFKLQGRAVDFSRGEVRFENGETCALSEREAQLLRYLSGHPGRVIPRDEIFAQVWRLNSSHLHTRVIDMHIAHLRAKLRDKKAGLLRTVYGGGYLLVTGE